MWRHTVVIPILICANRYGWVVVRGEVVVKPRHWSAAAIPCFFFALQSIGRFHTGGTEQEAQATFEKGWEDHEGLQTARTPSRGGAALSVHPIVPRCALAHTKATCHGSITNYESIMCAASSAPYFVPCLLI
jgi:hypothetical protein